MLALRVYLTRLAGLLRRQADADLDEELAEHLRLLEADLLARGTSPDAARRAARQALGGLSRTEHAVHDQRTWPAIERLWQDIRWSVRSLRRAPLFTTTAVLTLALGIGSTTAIVSVINISLFKPLPYPHSDRLVTLAAGGRTNFTGEEFYALRDRLQTPDALGADGGGLSWNLHVGGRATHVIGRRVSSALFDVLGVAPQRGRTFSAAEDAPNGPWAVVLSDRLWRSHFEARADHLGRVVELGGVAHQIVGVMPPDFRTYPDADLWTPLRLPLTDKGSNQQVIARLRPDATFAEANAELAARRQILVSELGWPRESAAVIEWQPYRQALRSQYRPVLLILLGAVGCVLLIACVNVAGLQLVRGSVRHAEMATRAAIGGSPRRLMREVLTESMVLSVAGAGVGVLCAVWALPSLAAVLPPSILDGEPLSVDVLVLAGVLITAILVGLLFGYVPARDARGVDVRSAMSQQGTRHTAGPATLRWRRALVMGQIALSLVLLVSTALLGRTLMNFSRVELGFEPQHLVIGTMSLTGVPTPAGREIPEFFEETLGRIRATPGVRQAAVTSGLPVARALNLPLLPPAGGQIATVRAVDWRYISTNFFETLGVPLRAGRLFAATDTQNSQPVVVVNERFARAYFGREAVLGRTLRLPVGTADEQYDMVVVGVVGDFRNASGAGWSQGGNALTNAPPPSLFVPVTQAPPDLLARLDAHWLVRTSAAGAGPASTAATVAQLVQATEPRLPFVRFQTMEEIVADQIEQQRALFSLLALFAAASVTLACVGIYGVTAYNVSARSRDIGIRMALGSTRLRVVRLLLHEGVVLTTLGIGVGLGGALLVSRSLEAYLWGVAPFDPVAFLAAATTLAAIAVLAILWPAVRAACLEPSGVLRQA